MFLGEQFIYILYNYLIIPLSESEDVPNSQNCLKEKDECEKCYTRRNAIQQMMKVRIKVLSPPELSAQCSSTLMHNMFAEHTSAFFRLSSPKSVKCPNRIC